MAALLERPLPPLDLSRAQHWENRGPGTVGRSCSLRHARRRASGFRRRPSTLREKLDRTGRREASLSADRWAGYSIDLDRRAAGPSSLQTVCSSARCSGSTSGARASSNPAPRDGTRSACFARFPRRRCAHLIGMCSRRSSTARSSARRSARGNVERRGRSLTPVAVPPPAEGSALAAGCARRLLPKPTPARHRNPPVRGA